MYIYIKQSLQSNICKWLCYNATFVNQLSAVTVCLDFNHRCKWNYED